MGNLSRRDDSRFRPFGRPERWRGPLSPTPPPRPRQCGGRRASSRKRTWHSKRSSPNTRKPAATRSTTASSRSRRMRQKIVSAVTSGLVPDLFQNNPTEIIALYAWDDKLVDVSDVVETQKAEYTETALLTAFCYNGVEKKRAFTACPIRPRVAEPYLAAAGREGGLQDRGHPEDLGRLLRLLQGRAEEIARPGHAQRLRPRVSGRPPTATTPTTCSTIF